MIVGELVTAWQREIIKKAAIWCIWTNQIFDKHWETLYLIFYLSISGCIFQCSICFEFYFDHPSMEQWLAGPWRNIMGRGVEPKRRKCWTGRERRRTGHRRQNADGQEAPEGSRQVVTAKWDGARNVFLSLAGHFLRRFSPPAGKKDAGRKFSKTGSNLPNMTAGFWGGFWVKFFARFSA